MKRYFMLIFFVVVLMIISKYASAVEMSNYCYAPPFSTQVVSPNVLFVMDYSGSMSWCAYNPGSDKRDCCNNSSGCGWTYRGDEEGYFEPNEIYEYNSSQGYWQKSSSSSASACPKRAGDINTSNKYRGSCLNFIYMRRIDLVRWAITGGKPSSCDNKQIQKCDPEIYGQPSANLSCDDYGCIIWSASDQKVKVSWSRINDGLAFQFKQLSPRPRIGALLYRGSSVFSKVYIGDFTASSNFDGVNPYKNFITAVNYESPSGSTPTAPAMWDAYNYFAQNNPRYGGLNPQSGEGDKWKNPMYQCFDDDGNGNCQGSELKNVYCAKNFVILLTDGQWNKGGYPVDSSCSIDRGYEDNSADPVVPAYKMHKVGFTNSKTGIYSYVEAVYGIGLWLGGTGEKSLKNVAMYGSFSRNKSWPDSLNDYPKITCGPIDDCCTSSNCGKGSACADLPPSSTDWDKNGDGVPDTFYSASNASEIKDAIRNAIFDIIARASSGTTVVALPPTSTTESSVMARAYFYPEKTIGGLRIKWIGELATLWFDSNGLVRENTDEADENNKFKILDVKKDKPLAFVFSGPDNAYVANVYGNLDDDGNLTSCNAQTKYLEDIKSIFESGSMLVSVNPNDRNIKTAIDSDGNGIVTSTEVEDFKTPLKSALSSYWSYGDSLGNCDENCAESVIKYVRGYDKPAPAGSSFRLRQLNSTTPDKTDTWKLGDTVYSTPKIAPGTAVNGYDVKYNDSTYSDFIRTKIKGKTQVIIMGANDGMIHAFRLGKLKDRIPPTYYNEGKQVNELVSDDVLGKEEWNYIPYNVLPYLRWYCQENYCHIPMLETTFTIVDASVGSPENPQQNPTGDKNVNSWRRLLIAQMGLGGTPITVGGKTFSSSIIVMDITNHLNPVLLWEQALPDRTLTFATPGIVRLGDRDKNGQWYLVIGSGPTAITTTSLSYPASPKIYVFDLKTGELKATLPVSGASNQAVGDMLSTDLDLPMGDYNVDDLYFGTYNDSSGALYRLRIRNGGAYVTEPTLWTITKVIDAERPVFAAPAVAHDKNGVRWLYFGTGIYLTSSHMSITNEKLFGIIEPEECWRGVGICKEVNESEDLLVATNMVFTQGKAVQYSCQCPGNITISEGVCHVDASGQIVCPSCPSGTQVITKIRDAVLTGATGPVATCNNKVEEEAISCIERAIYEYELRGWKRVLTEKKLYSSPVVSGGAVLATPFRPSEDVCSVGGDTYLLAVYYTTGTAYYQPIIRASGGTTGQLSNLVVAVEIELAKGPSPTKTSIVMRQAGEKTIMVTQVSGGIISTEITQPNPIKDMFIHWFTK